MTISYGFGTIVDTDFESTILKVTEELKKEGFGVLTEIDVQATMKKKLDKDMAPYRILGACNPQLAHNAITNEPSIGLLLPCNVLVRQDDEGKIHVEFMDPGAVLNLVDNPNVETLASEVKSRLMRVMDAL